MFFWHSARTLALHCPKAFHRRGRRARRETILKAPRSRRPRGEKLLDSEVRSYVCTLRDVTTVTSRPTADVATKLSRRAWLTSTLALMVAGCAPRHIKASPPPSSSAAGEIETVTGPVRADTLGVTLMHEHVLVDFIGASEVSRSRYDADVVFEQCFPICSRCARSDARRSSSARPPISGGIHGS